MQRVSSEDLILNMVVSRESGTLRQVSRKGKLCSNFTSLSPLVHAFLLRTYVKKVGSSL